jgi:chorismate synthase
MDRRRPGSGGGSSPRREEDRVEILSGTFEGKTTGTPISLIIQNRDRESDEYEGIRDLFRPGHGDITYYKKYGIRDHRGGGRASGRETAARVAAGAVARKILERERISVAAFTRELGGVRAEGPAPHPMDQSRLRCPDDGAARRMEARIEDARRAGDSLGGIVEILVRGCPPGLGDPVFGKIDADLAGALMSIGTVKGIEIGAGFEAARMTGSVCNDPITPEGFTTNNAGGILAGITSGGDIVIRVACKPVPSIGKEQQTVDIHGESTTVKVRGRHDVCVIPRIIPVCEAMVAVVLADHILRNKGTS